MIRTCVIAVLVASMLPAGAETAAGSSNAPASSPVAAITPGASGAEKELPGTDGEWTDNYTEAVKSAQATHRPIIIDFTGSDWCTWCMALHEEVFATPEFKRWAAGNAVLVVADFPQKKELPPETKKQNDELARMFGVDAFPAVVVVDASGKELARSKYLEGGAKHWIDDLAAKIGAKR